MSYKIKRYLAAVLLISSLCLLTAGMALAGDGDGEGNNPLELSETIPSNGQKEVPLDTEIRLTFTKNVVNMEVKEHNENCFQMVTEDGSTIPIEVIMADDQMEIEKRRDIVIIPKQELNEGTTYFIKVSPELKSKSGVTLGKELSISFTTAGGTESSSLYGMLGVILVVLIIVSSYAYRKFLRKKEA